MHRKGIAGAMVLTFGVVFAAGVADATVWGRPPTGQLNTLLSKLKTGGNHRVRFDFSSLTRVSRALWYTVKGQSRQPTGRFEGSGSIELRTPGLPNVKVSNLKLQVYLDGKRGDGHGGQAIAACANLATIVMTAAKPANFTVTADRGRITGQLKGGTVSVSVEMDAAGCTVARGGATPVAQSGGKRPITRIPFKFPRKRW